MNLAKESKEMQEQKEGEREGRNWDQGSSPASTNEGKKRGNVRREEEEADDGSSDDDDDGEGEGRTTRIQA